MATIQDNLDPFNREQNGITRRGTLIPKNEKSPYLFVFHCNAYNDGNGDIGNLIDIATQVIDYYGADNVTPVFVITASPYYERNQIKNEQLVKDTFEYFKKEAGYAFQKYAPFNPITRSFTFSPEHPISYGTTDDNFNVLIEKTELKDIYAAADGIFNIATPFPLLPESVKLKQGAQIINITEHNAVSYHCERSSIVGEHHYVTGVGNNHSGLMVKENSCDLEGSVKVLQGMRDQSYIAKLGLTYPVSDAEAFSFLEKTLVVPVYLGVSQHKDLAPLVNLVSQSPLGQCFEKIIFHVNQRAYDDVIYQTASAELKAEISPKVELIIGHYFDDPEDYQCIYQLSSNRGVAICSSDKALEKAISCSLFPLYPPAHWKIGVHVNFVDFVKDDQEQSKLFDFMGRTSCNQDENNLNIIHSASLLYHYKGKAMLEALKEGNSICSSLTPEVIQRWKENKRPALLKNSFYTLLQNQVLTPKPVQEKKEIKQPIADTEAHQKKASSYRSRNAFFKSDSNRLMDIIKSNLNEQMGSSRNK